LLQIYVCLYPPFSEQLWLRLVNVFDVSGHIILIYFIECI